MYKQSHQELIEDRAMLELAIKLEEDCTKRDVLIEELHELNKLIKETK